VFRPATKGLASRVRQSTRARRTILSGTYQGLGRDLQLVVYAADHHQGNAPLRKENLRDLAPGPSRSARRGLARYLTRRLQPQRLVRTNVVEHRHPVVARVLLNGTIAEISSTGLLSETDVSSSDGGAGCVCDQAFP
jgi:hypothetical protein